MKSISSLRDLSDLAVRSVGFFAGTFDPPHQGHVDTIEEALGGGQIEHLCICAHDHNPHKKHRTAPIAHRMQMLRIILRNSEACGQVSLSNPAFLHGIRNETFTALASELVRLGIQPWIVRGADSVGGGNYQLGSLPHLVATRSHHPTIAPGVLTGPVVSLDGKPHPFSSSRIRMEMARGRHHPHAEVAAYIRAHDLYPVQSQSTEPPCGLATGQLE